VLKVEGLRIIVHGVYRVKGFGIGVYGSGSWVEVLGSKVRGSGFRVKGLDSGV